MVLDTREHLLLNASLDLSEYSTHLYIRMKPTRIRMCHSLVMNYGLYKKMEIFVRR